MNDWRSRFAFFSCGFNEMGGIFFPQKKPQTKQKKPQNTNQLTNKSLNNKHTHTKKKKFWHFLVINMQLKIEMLTLVKKPAGVWSMENLHNDMHV